jgi:accessory colonization factor AcfC
MGPRPAQLLMALATAALGCAALPLAAAAQPLKVYGPGGPHPAMAECAQLFQQRTGIAVEVFKLLPGDLARKLMEDGDLYFGGAEFMLDELVRRHPTALDPTTAEKLHPRRVGIIVRRGNPRGIRAVEDLAGPRLRLLDVRLENMAPLRGPVRAHLSVLTGEDGLAAWREKPELDAWVTYRSWHVKLAGEAEFVALASPESLRYVPVALTRRTLRREHAGRFVAFLKSEEARRIFQRHGWE